MRFEPSAPVALSSLHRSPVKTLLARGHVILGLIAFTLPLIAPSTALADGPPVAADLAPPEVADVGPALEPPLPPAASKEPVEFLQVAHPSRVAAFIFGGVALVGVGVGTGFGIAALHDNGQYNPTTSTTSAASLGNQSAVVSDVGFGVAVIAGVTSVVLFLCHDDAPPAKAPSAVSFTLSPIAGPRGAGAGAVLHF
jgi:hypothetical protein